MSIKHSFLLFWAFGLMTSLTLAQSLSAQTSVIEGIVVEESTGDPIVGANIFIAETAIGTTTDQLGAFSFETDRTDEEELTISFVGYQTKTVPLDLTQEQSEFHFHIELEPDQYKLDDIVVATDNTLWLESYDDFRREFIGSGYFADLTTIENRWVIDFTRESGGALYAMASEPIIVENRALGYRLQIDMEDFIWKLNSGEGHFYFDIDFRELEPRNQAEYEQWQNNRRQAYTGSLQHFFRSLYRDELSRNDFEIVQQGSTQSADIYPQDRNTNVIQLLTRHRIPMSKFNREVKAFYMRGPVDVLYGQRSFRQDTRKRAGLRPEINNLLFLVRDDGTLVNRQAISVEGYWANERISTMLPSNYRP